MDKVSFKCDEFGESRDGDVCGKRASEVAGEVFDAGDSVVEFVVFAGEEEAGDGDVGHLVFGLFFGFVAKEVAI